MNTTEKSSSIAWRPTGDAAPKPPEVHELRSSCPCYYAPGVLSYGESATVIENSYAERSKQITKFWIKTKLSSRNMVGSEAIIISIEGTSNASRIGRNDFAEVPRV